MDYKDRIRQAVVDGESFVGLTLSAPAKANASRWTRVRVRPVLVKGARVLQFSYFDGAKDVAKNFAPADAGAPLDELLALGFAHAELQTTAGDLHVRVTRKGKALVSESRPSRAETPSLEHDRAKRRAVADDDPLWRALDLAGKDGRILPRARKKFTQVNEFLRLLDEALDEASSYVGGHLRVAPRAAEDSGGHAGPPLQEIHILDAGCGGAYLTFAAARHLPNSRVVGVDANAELIAKCGALARSLGADVAFRASTIADYAPETPPDVVLSLHACDTATDEALARGALWRSRVILAAPCCQHELHHALSGGPFAPVLRHGLLRERMADLLTDALRASALRVMGYHVQVCEFVSSEHTTRNLMLRAVRVQAPGLPRRSPGSTGTKPGDPAAAAEYLALRKLVDAAPAIERMLGEPFARLLR